MGFFEYGETEITYLSKRDKRLGKCIAELGIIKREVSDDFFGGLCYNIVNQQLSMKACDTLCEKITAQIGSFSPESITSADVLRSCGLSQSKAECLVRVAEMFKSGELSCEKASKMPDEELSARLLSVKGIGRWTVEMTLIFCLKRKDVLSLGDFGIRKGLIKLHSVNPEDKKALQKYKALYSPHGTVASLYLWEIAKLSDEEISRIIKEN